MPAEIEWRGKTPPIDYYKTRKEIMGKMGHVILQFIEPGNDVNPWSEFINNRGEGVHHLSFFVDDTDADAQLLAKQGCEITHISRIPMLTGGAYIVDIGHIPGILYKEILAKNIGAPRPGAPAPKPEDMPGGGLMITQGMSDPPKPGYPTEKGHYADFAHLALVVKDIDKARAHYEKLGIGPFRELGKSMPSLETESKWHGKPVKGDYYKTRRELNGKMGPIELQLIQPGPEPSPWKEWLDKHGDSVHHISFRVPDINKTIDFLTKMGAEIMHESRAKGRSDFAAIYVEGGTGSANLIMEFCQVPKN